MKPRRILGIIMAGGKGERLLPLTEVRSKPAVPFGGKYRIVDFVLSNFVNSDTTSLYVLVQYRSQSLIEHLRKSCQIVGRLSHGFVTCVPPQIRGRAGRGVAGPGPGRERFRDSGGRHTWKDDRIRGKAVRAQADARAPWLRAV